VVFNNITPHQHLLLPLQQTVLLFTQWVVVEAVAEADRLALKITTVVLGLLLAFLLNKSLLLEEPHTP
jgi:uncharacterized membrane protein